MVPAARNGKESGMSSSTVRAEIDDADRNALMGLSAGDIDLLAEGLELREEWRQKSGLDERAFAMVKIAALVALDAPPASYQWQVSNAMAAGVSAHDILGVLFAIAPQVGSPRVVAAAPEIMLALGLPLPDEPSSADSAR
jgi:4-carboxymuconolactone decarboxylase